MTKNKLIDKILETNLALSKFLIEEDWLWASNSRLLMSHYIDNLLKIYKRKIGIYKITSPSGRVYIGQSIDIDRRFNQYKKGQYCNNKLKNSFNKYGIDNHLFEIIIECDENVLDELEIKYIKEYDSIDNGFNVILGNTNCTRGEKNPMFGKTRNFSPEHKEKLRIAAKRPKSEETKLKISESRKGRKFGPHTKEHNEKIGKSNLGKHRGKRPGSKTSSRKVINKKTKQIFNTVKEAAEYESMFLKKPIESSQLIRRMRGKNKIHTDFMYLEEYNEFIDGDNNKRKK